MGKILLIVMVLSLYLLLRSVAKKNRTIPGDKGYVHQSTQTTEPGSKTNITTKKDLMCW